MRHVPIMCAADIDDTNECWENATCRVHSAGNNGAHFSAYACDEHAPAFFIEARRFTGQAVTVEEITSA